jgi:hypothetical protein
VDNQLLISNRDLVAFSESFYILSDCFNFSGKLTPQDVPPIFSRYGWIIPNCQSFKSGMLLETLPLVSDVVKLLITFVGQTSKFRLKYATGVRHPVMKRMRVQSRQDFVRYAASPLVRPCTSDPDCNWRRFDPWNWVDLFDKRSERVTHLSHGNTHGSSIRG